MIDRTKLNIIAQIMQSMEEAVESLEKSNQNRDSQNFNVAKKELLNFQKKLGEEMEEVKKNG